MIREKVPIHVQAFKEVADGHHSRDIAANDMNLKNSSQFMSNIMK